MHRPEDYGLPHDTFRPHQLETILKLNSMEPGDIMFLSAATGSGKTGVAAALASDDKRVIALAKTKLLQRDNYGSYGFVYLFGRPNYECPALGTSADMCEFPMSPKECMFFGCCPYYVRKAEAMEAKRVSLNYAYFMTAGWCKRFLSDNPDSSTLVLDECHMLSDIVIERSSVTIKEADRRKWGLPSFPTVFAHNTDVALEWLDEVRKKLDRKHTILVNSVRRDPSLQEDLTKLRELFWKVESCVRALAISSDDWFIRSGPKGRELDGNRYAPGFVCKPLTAKWTFGPMFLHGAPTIMMSATFGNFETFAEELGIDDYQTTVVPSVWGPDQRPVFYMKDCPKINYRSSPTDLNQQARLIVKAINTVPENWSGVVHCTSYKQVNSMARRLARYGLGDRVWVAPRGDTEKQMLAWAETKKHMRGALNISCTNWEGVDMLESNIVVVGKTPFPYCGDSYSKARMMFNGKFYLQRTAWKMQQGSGRTRRGRPKDYDRDGQRSQLVLIADNSWRRVQKYFDEDFRQSIVPLW